MDGRGRRERRGRQGQRGRRGRPRNVDANSGSEGSNVGSGPEENGPAQRGRQNQKTTEIIEAYERGRQAAGGGGHAPAAPHDETAAYLKLFDTFGKLWPPKFQGDGLEAAEEWLASIKSKFQVCRAAELYKVELATHYLENSARFWWENEKLNYEGDQERIPWDWFEEKFMEEYVGDLQQEEQRQRFMTLKQGDKTVAEYNAAFTALSRYAPDIRRDARRYHRHYLNGLTQKIGAIVDNPAVQNLRQLMQHAAQVEAHHKLEREEILERNVRQKGSKGQPVGRGKGVVTGSVSAPTPQIVGGSNNWCRTCNQPHEERYCRQQNMGCFNCGKTGHWRRDCPEPQQVGFSRGFVSGGQPLSGGHNAGRVGGQFGG